MTDHSDLSERLRAIEEDLRDRAYDALRAAAAGDAEAAADEKRLLKARRAVERALSALRSADRATDGDGP